MLRFECDYGEGAAPAVLDLMQRTNFDQTPGYGEDAYCAKAAAQIRLLCDAPDAAVHFFVGATQANLTVIAAALRPWQGVLCADTGHIHVHETGSIEATGHKVLAIPGKDGKITARQIKVLVLAHRADESFEHTVQPKLVYLSTPTELGTLYTLDELEAISSICRELGLYLFVDGARLGYGLAAKGNDVTLPDLARLCDVFYIGGTKVGALFGEAVVISNSALKEDFRYLIKQHGGMLAKGRLLGLQFEILMENDLYTTIAAQAIALADQIRDCLASLRVPMLVENTTNQIFPILPNAVLEKLSGKYVFCEQCSVDDTPRAVRICTSWATKDEAVEQLIGDVKAL